MTPAELDALQAKMNADAQAIFKKHTEKTEADIANLQKEVDAKVNAAVEKGLKGTLTQEQVKTEVAEALKEYGTKASTLEEAVRLQGDKINGLVETIKAGPEKLKSLDSIVMENLPKLKALHEAGTGFIRVEVKAAGITSISNTVQPMAGATLTSPYAPGIGGAALTLYDILRNPNFVSNYVNMGRTNQSRLAWINETTLQGLPLLTAEGATKPLTSRTFQVEYSIAKKIAAYIQLTDEFDADLPGLSTAVQRLLQTDVIRAFDDQIQTDVINNSTPFSLAGAMAGFNHQVFDATYWDALLAMETQVRLANFIPNVSLLNPVLWAKMQMAKDTVGRYNYPSQAFQDAINAKQGNKIFGDNAIVGDLNQFNVDIYEDFVLKMGWINDDLIKNQFTIVGEVRFHDYISNARKTAIVYGNAKYAAENINGGSVVISGS